MNEKKLMNRFDFIEYAEDEKHGYGEAADLLLLCGYDGFDGTVDEYDELMKEFRKREAYIQEYNQNREKYLNAKIIDLLEYCPW